MNDRDRRPAPRAPASTPTNQWQPLGPGTVLNESNCAPRLPGRVQALQVHPGNQRVYALAVNGGVWYSGDGGASWLSLGGFDSTPPAGIERAAHRNAGGAIAVRFGEGGAADIVYVGTGQVTHPYTAAGSTWMSGQIGRPYLGVGVLRCEHQPGTAVTWAREAPNLTGSGVHGLALEPGGDRVVAATLTGLWQRPSGASAGVDWQRTGGTPFDVLDDECSDVLWTPGSATVSARLWVWVHSGANAGLWVREEGQTDFARIETPGARGRRAVLAASASHVWVLADQPGLASRAPAPAAALRVARAGTDDDCSRRPLPGELRQAYARVGRAQTVQLVTYKVRGDRAYYQHDICLGTVAEVEAFSAEVKARLEAAGGPAVRSPRHVDVLRGVGSIKLEHRWPGGLVPWEADPTTRVRALAAIAQWEALTPMRFVERTAANSAQYPDYLSFEPHADACACYMGRRGGKQVVDVAAGCDASALVHEIGHGVGLWHEHCRHDRDDHVTIHLENVEDDEGYNFDKNDDAEDIGPYDYASIMHYGTTFFSKNGQDTIVPHGGQTIGMSVTLSAGDIAAVQWMYPELDWPRLFQVSNGALAPVADGVLDVPDMLTRRGTEFMALAVGSGFAPLVLLGGYEYEVTTADGRVHPGQAAILAGDVSSMGGRLRFRPDLIAPSRGLGVPPGIRHLVVAGTTVWAAGDGGVFRSDRGLSSAGFHAASDGIQATEAVHLAPHPSCEGRIVATVAPGMLIERLSNGVWRRLPFAGTGGIAYDALRPDRFVVQVDRGRWVTSDGELGSGGLLSRGSAFARTEAEASAAQSVPATIAHRQGDPAPAAPNVTQLLVGTNRLWYSNNLGGSWVTLPSADDPLPGDTSQDEFEEPVIVCAWQSPDVAWVLGEGRIYRYAREPGSDAGGGPGSWSREKILRRGAKPKKDDTTADGPIRQSAPWTALAVNLDAPPSPGAPPVAHGPRGAVYLGGVGKVGVESTDQVDTLWWFDGTSKWFPTSLGVDATAAPVTAIACDPAEPEVVYVGTTLGVWRGIRTQIGDAVPAWTWSARLNGLPEAPVRTLHIFVDGGVRLLRAGLAGRGAWELRLDAPDLAPLTYLRAHGDDLRHRPRAMSVKPDGTTPRSWHGSPDVRPRSRSTAQPAPSSLPWTRSTFRTADAPLLRLFQAALREQTGDLRVRASGRWDAHFDEVLRDRGAPLMAGGPANTVSIDTAYWDLHVQAAPPAALEPWGARTPTETDLLELSPRLAEGDRGRTSCTLPRKPGVVDVVIQRRGEPVAGLDVRVALLVWTDPAAVWSDSSSWFTGDVPWTAAVNEVMNSDLGITSEPLGVGWRLAELVPEVPDSLMAQTLDPLHPGIATFDLDFSGFAEDTVLLLVAVIRYGTETVALTADTLENLALSNANVAVRSVRVSG